MEYTMTPRIDIWNYLKDNVKKDKPVVAVVGEENKHNTAEAEEQRTAIQNAELLRREPVERWQKEKERVFVGSFYVPAHSPEVMPHRVVVKMTNTTSRWEHVYSFHTLADAKEFYKNQKILLQTQKYQIGSTDIIGTMEGITIHAAVEQEVVEDFPQGTCGGKPNSQKVRITDFFPNSVG
jgi:hypothetical protein